MIIDVFVVVENLYTCLNAFMCDLFRVLRGRLRSVYYLSLVLSNPLYIFSGRVLKPCVCLRLLKCLFHVIHAQVCSQCQLHTLLPLETLEHILQYTFIKCFPKAVQIKLSKVYREIVLIWKCMLAVPIEEAHVSRSVLLSTSVSLLKLTFFYFTFIS